MSSNLEKVQVENKLCDCVFMEVQVVPRGTSSTYSLHASINFAQETLEIDVPKYLVRSESWKVVFGISKAELAINLKNLSAPLTQRFSAKLGIDIQGNIRKTTGRADAKAIKESTTDSWGVSVKKGPSLGLESAHSSEASTNSNESTEVSFPIKRVFIHTKGDATYPKWYLRSQLQGTILEGLLETELATLNVVGMPIGFEATLKPEAFDHRIVNNALFENQSPRRQRIIDIRIMKSLQALCDGFISKVTLSS